MSGKHFKAHEVSCCIKYFIFGFNIIFWVSPLFLFPGLRLMHWHAFVLHQHQFLIYESVRAVCLSPDPPSCGWFSLETWWFHPCELTADDLHLFLLSPISSTLCFCEDSTAERWWQVHLADCRIQTVQRWLNVSVRADRCYSGHHHSWQSFLDWNHGEDKPLPLCLYSPVTPVRTSGCIIGY